MPLVVAIVTFAAYYHVVNSGYISFDDPVYVSDNHHIKEGITLESARWALTTTRDGNWFPLTWLSYMLDVSVAGTSPRVFHTANLLYHLLNGSLLFAALYLMTGHVNRSALVAALFAIHPLHVESVAWISERKDLLSALFLFLTIISYIKFRERPSAGRYMVTLILFVCGLMSKSMIVTAPLLLLLLDYWPLGKTADIPGKSCRTLFLEKIPFIIISLMTGLLTFALQKKAVVSFTVSPLISNIGNAAVSYVHYIYKTFIPTRLSIMYPFPVATDNYRIVGAICVLTAVSVMVWLRRKRQPYLLVGWCWYLIALLPVSGVIQVGKQAMADRYTYIPLAGFFVMIVWGISELKVVQKRSLQSKVCVVLCIVSVLFIVTRQRVACWRDSISLFSQAVTVTENNWFALGVLGYDYLSRNELQTAYVMLNRSLAINPENVMALYNMGVLYSKQGDYERALHCFFKCLYFEPDHGMAHYQIGLRLAARGDVAGALREYTVIKGDEGLDPEISHHLLRVIRNN